MDKRRETRGKVSVAARALFIVETIEQVAYYDGPFFHLSSWPYLSVALSQTPFSVPTSVRSYAASFRFHPSVSKRDWLLVHERPARESCMNGMKETRAGIERENRERWWEGRMIDVWMDGRKRVRKKERRSE